MREYVRHFCFLKLVSNQLRISPSPGLRWWANAVGNLDCCLGRLFHQGAVSEQERIPFFAFAHPQGHKQVCEWNNYAWHVCSQVFCTALVCCDFSDEDVNISELTMMTVVASCFKAASKWNVQNHSVSLCVGNNLNSGHRINHLLNI